MQADATAEALRAKGCYRKMGWFVETCFSASVMQRIEGTPGMMAITAKVILFLMA